MRVFARGLWLLAGLLSASTLTVSGWGADNSSPAADSGLAQPVVPPALLDPHLLDYNRLDFSRTPRKFAPATESSGINFDFKTDYEVDIEKFLPTDQFPQRSLMPVGKLQNNNLQKRTVPYLGLSISKPLN